MCISLVFKFQQQITSCDKIWRKNKSQKKKNLLKVRKKGISFYRSLKSKEIKHLESKCKKYHFIFFMLESGYGSGK